MHSIPQFKRKKHQQTQRVNLSCDENLRISLEEKTGLLSNIQHLDKQGMMYMKKKYYKVNSFVHCADRSTCLLQVLSKFIIQKNMGVSMDKSLCRFRFHAINVLDPSTDGK